MPLDQIFSTMLCHAALALKLLSTQVPPSEIQINSVLAVRIPGNRRSAIRRDPIEYQVVTSQFQAPRVGDSVASSSWAHFTADASGNFQGAPFGGGYAYAEFEVPKNGIWILEAVGSTVSYVNGIPHTGDPYQYGYAQLPVELKKGKNWALFSCGRGRLSAKFTQPPSPVFLNLKDLTLPDLTPNTSGGVFGGIILVNAQNQPESGLSIESRDPKNHRIVTKIPPIPPLSTRKVKVDLNPVAGEHTLTILGKNGRIGTAQKVSLVIKSAGEPYRRTFISAIDGSVQYYGVNPSSHPKAGQSLFLSLHGASVEAIGQAQAYGNKDWGTLVAPTNRRPFGFDWEDIGRLDALEVLETARAEFKPDPQRIFLTGHSMGGHGTWHLGATFPDKFGAIAPSAGWASFWSYAGGATYNEQDPIEVILRRASNASDTLALKQNLHQNPVFILHGDADDNVPVSEARNMRAALFDHPALNWHEQKGAGHWWSEGDAPGARCVDHPNIFSMFKSARIERPEVVRRVQFVTASPGVSSRNHWVEIENQHVPYAFSRVDLTLDPISKQVSGTTANVRRLTLTLTAIDSDAMVKLSLDGQDFEARATRNKIHLLSQDGKWRAQNRPAPSSEKNPVRSGGFKDIFKNQVILVYGTSGSQEENEWSINKARFDAEQLWYRGNGAVDVVSDTEFLKMRPKDRNVLMYGHSESNLAVNRTLDLPEVKVTRGSARFGQRVIETQDAAVLVIGPRKGSKTASAALVGGTGLTGMRLSDRSSYFVSGAGFPDYLIYTPQMLNDGSAGIKVAGFFGPDWKVESGQFGTR